MVAKSYQSLPLIGEPFKENGREYIYVEKNGTNKKVRWYSETEFSKAFKTTPAPTKAEEFKKIGTTKDVLGFNKGYITIFKGDTYSLLDWFHESLARYHNTFGWYFVSTDELPTLPEGISPVQIKWEDVADVERDELKPRDEVRKFIDALIYESTASEYQGEVGDRIDRILTVKKVIQTETNYGSSSFHIFVDEDGNEYTWSTTSKTLEEGDTYKIRGTIKALQVYRNSKQTVLTRCRIGG